MSEIKETDLYSSFVKLVTKLTSTFQTREDVLLQRNAIEKWTELVTLFNLFTEKLQASKKSIPDEKFLMPLLVELSSECIGMEESSFIEKYLELEICMIEPPDDPRVWCYLHPLDCSVKMVDLNGPLRIRKATILERAFYCQERPPMRFTPTFIAETKSGFVQSILNKDKTKSAGIDFHLNMSDNPPFGDDFFTLVSILRLLKPSPIGYDSLVLQEKSDSVEYSATYQVSPWKHPCTLGVIGNLQSDLCNEDIDNLKLLWKNYHLTINALGVKRTTRLQRAIRRYELAICSNEIEDAIVDSVIALETLFEIGGEEMAIRASKLVGANEKSRDLINQILNAARRMRNAIVHGDALDKTDEKVDRYLLSILGRILVCAIVLSKEGKWFADLIKEATTDTDKMTKLQEPISKWLIR